MKSKYKWIIGILVLLIALRIVLPFFLVQHISTQLDRIEGYYGWVEDVDLQLYRGGFQLEELKIFEESSNNPEIPLVDLPLLDFSIQWNALFKSEFVGEVYLDSLSVNFVTRQENAQTKVDSVDQRLNLISEIQKFNPVLINIFEIKNGEISYSDPTTDPKINVELQNFYLRAKNLGNVVDESKELPANIVFHSETMDSGYIHMEAEMNYLLNPPDFDFDAKVENIDIPRFNEFFEAYANLDIEKGNFNLFAEGKARDGKLEGYMKPLVVGLKVAPADSTDGVLKQVYEGAVGLGAEIFENQDKDQTGTKVPISGSLDRSETENWQSFWNFLKNAFVEASKQEIDRTIEFNSKKE